MNICDFDSRGRLGYDFQHAGFTPTAAMTTETSLTLEGVAETAAVLNTMTGNPFALTSEVSATATNETREILNTPESYVRQVAEGYYRLKLADGSGKYLDCKSFEDREHDQAGCYYTITDNTMSAGTIFYLKQTSGGNSYIVSLEEMSSQGQPISSGTYTLYPFGGGKVALLVYGTDGVEDKYYNYSQGIDMMVMSAYYDEPTLYYLEKVETFDIKLNAISGDPYTYATLYLPFDVTLPDNTYAYMGAREGSGKIFCTKIAEPGDVLAAGTPVVIVNEAKETQVTLLLPNGSPIAERGAVFRVYCSWAGSSELQGRRARQVSCIWQGRQYEQAWILSIRQGNNQASDRQQGLHLRIQGERSQGYGADRTDARS